MTRRLLGAALLVPALGSCKQPPRDHDPVPLPGAAIQAPRGTPVDPPPPSAFASTDPPPEALVPPFKRPDPPPAPPTPLAPGDVCRITRGPVQVAYTGQATLWIDDAAPDHDVKVVFNHDGVPRAAALATSASPKPASSAKAAKPDAKAPERLALSEPAERLVLPPCAAAGGRWFCVDRTGAVHRSAALGQEGAVVAQARPGSPVAAATIAGGRAVYAYLADRRTTEGAVTLAFAGLDDNPPGLLSEDGAGATSVSLAARGDEVVALYVDARRVLTPVHARILNGGSGKLVRGPDAVLFVGGGTDAITAGVLAQGAPGSEMGLLAIEKDDKEFGMVAIRIDEQPRDDAPATWSLYPAATERAPLAATQGTLPVRVLRVRAASADPKAKKVLELGELDAAGVYKPSCPVAERSKLADPAIAVDRQGAVWLAYTDGDGTWVERRGR